MDKKLVYITEKLLSLYETSPQKTYLSPEQELTNDEMVLLQGIEKRIAPARYDFEEKPILAKNYFDFLTLPFANATFQFESNLALPCYHRPLRACYVSTMEHFVEPLITEEGVSFEKVKLGQVRKINIAMCFEDGMVAGIYEKLGGAQYIMTWHEGDKGDFEYPVDEEEIKENIVQVAGTGEYKLCKSELEEFAKLVMISVHAINNN